MKKGIMSISIFGIVVGLLLSCAKTRLEDYQPGSTQEKEVLEVFNKMVKARENEDFEAYMTFFYDDAKIFKRLHPGSNNGSFLSKQQYTQSPEKSSASSRCSRIFKLLLAKTSQY